MVPPSLGKIDLAKYQSPALNRSEIYRSSWPFAFLLAVSTAGERTFPSRYLRSKRTVFFWYQYEERTNASRGFLAFVPMRPLPDGMARSVNAFCSPLPCLYTGIPVRYPWGMANQAKINEADENKLLESILCARLFDTAASIAAVPL